MEPDNTPDSLTLTTLPEVTGDPAPVATGPQAARAEDHKQAVCDQIATQLPMAARAHHGIPGRCDACTQWNADSGWCGLNGYYTAHTTPPATTTTTSSKAKREAASDPPPSCSSRDPRANLPSQSQKWRGNSCASDRRRRIIFGM